MALFTISFGADKTTTATLARIEGKFDAVNSKLEKLMLNVDALLAAVAAQTTIDDSIEALLTQVVTQNKDLAAQLAKAIADNDPVALAAAQKAIDDSATTLLANVAKVKAAVTENTTV